MEQVFDTGLLVERKKRALRAGTADADFLMRRVAEDLGERLSTVGRDFPEAAALFCQTATAGDVLRQSGKVGNVHRIEADAALLGDRQGMIATPETVPLPAESLDLAVSLLSLHSMNDIPGMLIQIRRALRPDGLFLGALAGSGTLAELRESLLLAETELSGGASPRVAPFVDVRDAGGLLQRAGFALPVADTETIRVRYPSMFELMRDLRAMGETSILTARPRRPVPLRLFTRAAEIYAERHAEADGRIPATFQIVWLSGWAPHASQQQPLRPGSATARLADVLASGGKNGG
ncbi:class I SAM-dependent methyltransferase [Mesorhizobium koreense]|uniref:class I SAM-dependent methyltransferase n=1 Tax=Mesorhizobium koreense TaxID=3074855 RepID=UPI00287B86DB|nr:methyltransferase domain-containing protein [Mesorhizobium sp. WR6]